MILALSYSFQTRFREMRSISFCLFYIAVLALPGCKESEADQPFVDWSLMGNWSIVRIHDKEGLSWEYPSEFDPIIASFDEDSVLIIRFCPTTGTDYAVTETGGFETGSMKIQEVCETPYDGHPSWNLDLATLLLTANKYRIEGDSLFVTSEGRYDGDFLRLN